MPERGVLGGFLGFAVVPMILNAKWRPLSWFGVVLVLSVILLAGTRTGLILAALSTMVYVMVNRGTGFWQLALGVVVVAAQPISAWVSCPVPREYRIAFRHWVTCRRTGPLKAGRAIYQDSLGAILTNPFGLGLGATGLSGRVNTGDTGNVVRYRGCWLFGNCIPIRLAWSPAYYLCAVAHVAGNEKALPNGIQALRGDARQSIHDRLDPGLFRREYHHSIFDSLDRVRRGAGSSSIPDFYRQAANFAKIRPDLGRPL